jgi:hypothetical protein
MGIFTKLAQQIFASADESGNPRTISEQEVGVWGTEIERVVSLFISSGGLVYASKALLDGDLARPANTLAWVIGDPTAANNGLYGKVGASGTGSWTRRGDLPYSFIIATNVGAGTANALQATTALPVSSSALVMLNITTANTATPVTVSFNGGAALTVKSNSGNNVSIGGLTAGMVVLGVVSGSTFRLVSDQSSAAILAAAEAAAARAEAAATLAGSGFVFPELMPSWNPSDTGPAIEAASVISAASGGQVKLTAGRVYPVSKIAFAAACSLAAIGASIAVAGTRTGAQIDITLGNFMKFDELVITSPGTEANTDICQVGIGVRGLYLEASSTVQRAGGGILISPQDVDIEYIKTRKIDRPIHLYNTSVTAQTTGTRIGFLDAEDYVRTFRATFTEFSLGGIWCVGRSPNAAKSPGHNTALIVGCRNWDIGDIWSEDTGEHVVRIGGSEGVWAVTANYTIGNITALRSGGCVLKVNPTLNTTIAGTVAVASGSATLTGTGTSFLTALKRDSNVRVVDTGEVYRVTAIASNTSSTLDRIVSTTDASSPLEVMEAAWNGSVGNIVGIDVGDTTVIGNEELIRLSHVRGLKIGNCVAFRDGALVSSQYLVQVNDVDDVEIAAMGGTGVNSGFISIDGSSDINADPLEGPIQFGGDVTNLRIGRMHGNCSGNNAIIVNTAYRVGKVSIGLDNCSGFLVSLVRWDAGTLNGVFELRGRVTGSVPPAYLTVPNSDLFLVDVAYNNTRSVGRGSGSRPGTAMLEVLAGAFSSASGAPTGLFLNGARATAGNGSYGVGMEFSRLGSSRRGASVVPKQMTSDDKKVALAFLYGDTASTTNEALQEAFLAWGGGMALPDGVTAPATAAGYAILYVDAADGDLKVKFGDGTTKTIVVDT